MESVTYTVKPSLKMYFPQFFLIGSATLIVLYLMMFTIPENGIYIFQVINIQNQWLHHLLIKFLRFKITKNTMFYSLCGVLLVLLQVFLYYFYLVKSYSYTVTNKFFQIEQGIADRITDSIDMVNIKTQELHRSPSDLALGLAQIKIWTKEPNEPEIIIKGLLKLDADKVFQHLQLLSTRSYSDRLAAEDLRRGQRESAPVSDEVDGAIKSMDDRDKDK